MKRLSRTDTLPSWLQWSIFGCLAAIFVLLPFHAFISTWGGTAIGPLEAWKSWKEVLLVIVAIPLAGWLSLKPRRWQRLLDDTLAWWLLAFIAILLFLSVIYLHANGTAATLAGLAMSGRYLLAFALAYTLLIYGEWHRTWEVIRRRAAAYVLVAGVVVAVLGLIQVLFLPNDFLVQFGYDKQSTIAPYTLIDQNPADPRAFATLRGPNDFGAFLILPLLLTLVAARRHRGWVIAALIILLAIFESASRSAWLGTMCATGVWIGLTYGRMIMGSRSWRVGIVAACGIAGIVVVAALSIPSVRLEVFHSSPSDSSLTEGSTDNHWRATSAGIGRVIANPIGCGAGCAGPASYYGNHPHISENYYVQIAEETGLSGLILWIGIATMVLRRLWRQRQDYLARSLFAAFIGISVIGLWLHVWADDPLSLTWWLLAGAILGYYAHFGYDKSKLNKQKTNNDRKTKKEISQIRT